MRRRCPRRERNRGRSVAVAIPIGRATIVPTGRATMMSVLFFGFLLGIPLALAVWDLSRTRQG